VYLILESFLWVSIILRWDRGHLGFFVRLPPDGSGSGIDGKRKGSLMSQFTSGVGGAERVRVELTLEGSKEERSQEKEESKERSGGSTAELRPLHPQLGAWPITIQLKC